MPLPASMFYDRHGRLTAYALACGYREVMTFGSVRLMLWAEHGVYHVRAHDEVSGIRLFWDSFPRLGEGRRRFNKAMRALSEKAGSPCAGIINPKETPDAA